MTYGVRWANTARALARWQHLGALHEATNTIHQVMCLVLYQPSDMVVAFAVYFCTSYNTMYIRVAII